MGFFTKKKSFIFPIKGGEKVLNTALRAFKHQHRYERMITKNLSTCKPASTKLLNPIDIGSGNIFQTEKTLFLLFIFLV
jgi:hypothetical protein